MHISVGFSHKLKQAGPGAAFKCCIRHQNLDNERSSCKAWNTSCSLLKINHFASLTSENITDLCIQQLCFISIPSSLSCLRYLWEVNSQADKKFSSSGRNNWRSVVSPFENPWKINILSLEIKIINRNTILRSLANLQWKYHMHRLHNYTCKKLF